VSVIPSRLKSAITVRWEASSGSSAAQAQTGVNAANTKTAPRMESTKRGLLAVRIIELILKKSNSHAGSCAISSARLIDDIYGTASCIDLLFDRCRYLLSGTQIFSVTMLRLP
jgi:hypothetical protein